MDLLACVEVPGLPLQQLLQAHPDWRALPAAVVDEDRPQGRVLWVNNRARKAGVMPGARYGPALSLSPTLRAGTIDAAAIQVGVACLLDRLRGFSPDVEPSAREPGVFWLDAGGLEGLFSSPQAWALALRLDLENAGYVAGVGVGFRRFGTYAAAKALRGQRVLVFETLEDEEEATAGVPLSLLGLPPGVRDELSQLGVSSIGEFLRLPAHGLARRFGAEAYELYRFASGDWELPLNPTPAEVPLEAHAELEYGEANAERLVFIIKPLVDRLLFALGQQGRALIELQLRLTLDRAPERLERIRTAEPTLSSVGVMELVKLRLAAAPLPAAAIGLVASATAVMASPEQLRMFVEAPRRDPLAAARAFARLRAAFGREDIVVKASPRDRHAPEGHFAWEPLYALALPRPRPEASPRLVRRMLAKPEALPHWPAGGLEGWLQNGLAIRLAGPYRLAGGWWRGGIQRDYYFAELRQGELLWVFYDRERRGWFLHGEIFVTPGEPSAVPLWCKSNFSFLEGASHPEELVEAAHRLGLRSLALTDRDGVYGIVRAHVRARELGVHLIIGSQVSLEDGTRLVLLVQDRGGYANLCRLLTLGRLRSPKGQSQVSWSEVCEHAQGLIALWGGEGSRLLAPVAPDGLIAALREAFDDRLYALLARHLSAEDVAAEGLTRERARRYGLALVAATEVLYHQPARRPLQDVLACIRHGVSLPAAGRRLKPNGEHALPSPRALADLFADAPEALAASSAIAARCTFSLAELRYRYPSERLPDGTTSTEWLRGLVTAGARRRYGDAVPADVSAQLVHELNLIERLDYAGYFLGMREIVEFCSARGILCQGRGSAANSVVCFCLGITAIDPVRMGLLFERFISEERAEPPDIDLDIEHERREEVIQHVYEKYGRAHAAMVAVVITYRPRSAVRDVGKALGLPETELNRLGKLLSHHGELPSEAFRQAELDFDQPVFKHLFELANELLDFPRHLSIHPGGFLLGHQPVHDLVPIENGTMANRTVIQWDKNDVEALGLFKVDLLGLGTLTHLHRCFDLLKLHRGIDLTMASVPAEDAATYAMLGRADTVGVFQVESRAQMAMLPRLKPVTYYDLVIEISLVRPGPITGGMVHPYLRRRTGQEAVDYAHKSMEPILAKTLGVPLFQEQVMKLAIVAASYTPGEADQLRRDMAAYRKNGRIDRHRERLIGGMRAQGIAVEFAERVFKQIEGFGDYGFPEAHAASFALLSYIGAYLRCHHPVEFTCSLLNAQPMGFYSPATIVSDARRHGLEIRPLGIGASRWDCTLEPNQTGFAIRMGLRFVKGLGTGDWQRIEAAGEAPFANLEDFVWRTDLSEKALVALAEAGAFEPFGRTRREALWEVRGLAGSERTPLALDSEGLPGFVALSLFETINWDYQHANHSPRGHPLEPLRSLLAAKGLPSARGLGTMRNGRRARYAGIVICRQRPGTAGGVTFMTMEDETGFVNLVVWPKVFERHARLAKTVAFLGVDGRLQVQQGIIHLIVERFWLPEFDLRPLDGGSRDFR